MFADSSSPLKAHTTSAQTEQLGLGGKQRKDARRFGPLPAVLVVLFSYLAGQIVSGFLVSLYPAFRGWDAIKANAWLEHAISAQFTFVLLSKGIILLILWWYLRRRKSSFKAIGLRKPHGIDIAYALLGVVAYFGLYIILISFVSLITDINVTQEQDVGFKTATGIIALAMAFISLVVLAPIVEETAFRGVLYRGLRQRFGSLHATLLTSALFAAPHLFTSGDGKLLWVAAVDTFALSIVLCYLADKTGRLASSIGVHAAKNAIAFSTLFIIR